MRLKVEKPDEIILAHFKDHTYEVKTHFIHLVEKDSEKWKDLLFFRTYLNQHQDDRENYSKIKQRFAADPEITIDRYTDQKWAFVSDILNKRRSQ